MRTPLLLLSSLLTSILLLGSLLLWPGQGTGLLIGFCSACLPLLLALRQQAHEARTRAARQDAFIQNFIDVIPQPVYIKDEQSRYLMVNASFAAECRMPINEIIGRSSAEIARDKKDGSISRNEDIEVLVGRRLLVERQDINPLTGSERHRVISKNSCMGPTGRPVLVGTNFDISGLRISERELRSAKQDLQMRLAAETALRERTEAFIQRLIDVIPDPVFIKKSGGRYLMVNEAFAHYRDVDKASFTGFTVISDPQVRQMSHEEDERVLQGEEITKEDHVIRQSTGEEVFRIIHKRRSVFIDGDPVVVGVEHHITRWRLAERELKRLAEEDALTGLANRRHFSRWAERAIEQASRYGEHLSLVMFDLDFFKQVNDSHGHGVGDEVLCEMARRIERCLRKSDLPCRWGGEEFVALLPHTRLATALNVAERLREEFATVPIQTRAGALTVTLSGGAAEFKVGEDLEALIARADEALYRAKHEGRNRIASA